MDILSKLYQVIPQALNQGFNFKNFKLHPPVLII
jgi:hypothetical protein